MVLNRKLFVFHFLGNFKHIFSIKTTKNVKQFLPGIFKQITSFLALVYAVPWYSQVTPVIPTILSFADTLLKPTDDSSFRFPIHLSVVAATGQAPRWDRIVHR